MISRLSSWFVLALLLGAPWMAAAESALERPFTLVDTNGRMISDKDLRDRWLLVFAFLGAALSALAVLWQGLPALIV